MKKTQGSRGVCMCMASIWLAWDRPR